VGFGLAADSSESVWGFRLMEVDDKDESIYTADCSNPICQISVNETDTRTSKASIPSCVRVLL